MKDKKKTESLIDSWGDAPVKKKLTKGEKRREILKPKNKSYVDRFAELEKDFNTPVFEGEEEITKEIEEKDDRDENKEREERH